jgi:hypothetical protein
MSDRQRLVRFTATCLVLAGAARSALAEEKVLFIGNSFTNRGPVPNLVCGLAIDAGWTTPTVSMVAVTGETLAYHRTYTATLNAVDVTGSESPWNHVVLQDLSVRPTDPLQTPTGIDPADIDPAGFKDDATWFYDRVKATSPQAQVVLYETWARKETLASFYPAAYPSRTAMQNQLNYHYHDAAESYIPANATAAVKTDVTVAPVGEAWQQSYVNGGMNLHDTDSYHANIQGQYLNALVLYSTIFNRSTVGLAPLNGVSSADARTLQLLADGITGKTMPGGAGGVVKGKGISNGSFEANTAGDGVFLFTNGYGVADGWILSGARTNGAGTRNSKTDFPNTAVTGGVDHTIASPGEGYQYLMLNSGTAMQRLADTLEANSTYTLTAAVGRRLTGTNTFYSASFYVRLYAGDSTLLGEYIGDTGSLTEGTFANQTLTYTTGASVLPDQHLRIEMGIISTTAPDTAGFNGLAFDNFRLSTTLVPEPTCLAALGLVGGLLVARRRR